MQFMSLDFTLLLPGTKRLHLAPHGVRLVTHSLPWWPLLFWPPLCIHANTFQRHSDMIFSLISSSPLGHALSPVNHVCTRSDSLLLLPCSHTAIQGTNPRGARFWKEVSVTKSVAAALEMVAVTLCKCCPCTELNVGISAKHKHLYTLNIIYQLIYDG